MQTAQFICDEDDVVLNENRGGGRQSRSMDTAIDMGSSDQKAPKLCQLDCGNERSVPTAHQVVTNTQLLT